MSNVCRQKNNLAPGNQEFFTTNATEEGVLELQNGIAVSNLSASTGNELHYFFSIPVSGTTSLEFKIVGGTSDVDLYVRYGAQPTEASWDYRPWL